MKKIVNSNKAPKPIGPYSQAVLKNKTLYVSGQIPFDVESGQLIKNGIKEETEQVMKNISFILEEVNYSFEDIVMSNIFISDMNDFPQINEVYGKYFKKYFPARATVQVAKLPLSVNVEISVIAMK